MSATALNRRNRERMPRTASSPAASPIATGGLTVFTGNLATGGESRFKTMGELLAEARAKYPPVEHPVVRVHPVTGKKILYVNPTFTSHIKGLPRVQSDALLAQLYALITVPEYQPRLRWQPNTLAVWDNRSTQHYAVGDYFPQHRKLHRITFTADQAF